jgi:dienelactone hydrolase
VWRSTSALAFGLWAAASVADVDAAFNEPRATQQEPPKRKEIEELAAEYFAFGAVPEAAGRARRAEILELVARVGPLDERDEKKWRKDLLEIWEDGATLPKKSGEHWFFEEGSRGRYFIGGKTKRPKGLLIGMHGGGVGSGDASSSFEAYGSAAGKVDWVAIFPEVLEKTERGWTDAGTEEWILELVERGRRTFGVDADRVYFAGHSMGGFGSWTLGAHHADRVAALAPAAGAPTPLIRPGSDEITGIDWGVVPSLRNVPMCVYQSLDDPRVPPDANQAAVLEVERAKERWGGYEDFTYWEVDGRGHGYPPGGTQAHLERIEDFEREPRPAKLVWQPVLEWKHQFYWLRWRDIEPGVIVTAEFDAKANAFDVTMDTPREGLELLVDGELVDFDREVVVRFAGEEVWRGVPEPRLEVLIETSAAGDPGRQYSAKIPVPLR